MFDITPGAVSQTRTWLESSWRPFQGDAEPAKDESGTRAGGPAASG
jgi:hypothetical protein